MLRKCIHKTELHPENRTPSLVKWVFTLVRFVWLHETSIFDHRQANVKFIIDSFRIWLHYLSAKHDAFSNSYWMIEAIMSSFNIPLACTVIIELVHLQVYEIYCIPNDIFKVFWADLWNEVTEHQRYNTNLTWVYTPQVNFGGAAMSLLEIQTLTTHNISKND